MGVEAVELKKSVALRPLLETNALDRVISWLSEADDGSRAQARRELRGGRLRPPAYAPAPWPAPATPDVSQSLRAALAVALETPAKAASTMVTSAFWANLSTPAARGIGTLAAARGAQWCAPFVERVSSAKLPARGSGYPVYVMLRRLVDAHQLDCPQGPAFSRGWAESCTRGLPVDDPLLPELVTLAIRHGWAPKIKDFSTGVLRAIELGRLQRADVLRACLETLTTDAKPASQQAIAGLLTALAVTVEDLPGLAYLLTVLGTGHSTVLGALLPSALRLVADETDLLDLTTVIAAQRTQKHRQVLLTALTSAEMRARVGDEAVLAALRLLADQTQDPLWRKKIDEAFGKLGESRGGQEPAVATEPFGLWAARVPFAPQEVQRTTLWSETIGPGIFISERASLSLVGAISCLRDHERLLADLVRAGAADPAGTRDRLATAWQHYREWDGFGHGPYTPFGCAVRDWIAQPTAGADLDDYRRALDRWSRRPEFLMHPTGALLPSGSGGLWRYMLTREALHHLGRHRELLSEPTRPDGSIDVDTVLARLRTRDQVPPIDLAWTLFRLRPGDRARVGDLDGLRVPIDDSFCWRESSAQDAVTAVRGWLLDDPRTSLVVSRETSSLYGHYFAVPRVPPLPVPVPAAAREPGYGPELLRLIPGHPDLALGAAPNLESISGQGLAGAGVVTHWAVLRKLVQQQDLEPLLRLLVEGFDPARAVEALVIMLDEGELRPRRLVEQLELVFQLGGLAQLWAPCLELAAIAVGRSPSRSGTVDLLGLLARFVPEVPEVRVPEPIRALAGSTSSSKSAGYARQLVARAALAPALVPQ